MRHEEIFRKNIIHYPKVMLFGILIGLTKTLKNITTGLPMNEQERIDLIHATSTLMLIADSVATKENNILLKRRALKYEIPKFGFKTIEEFNKKWDEYGTDYFRLMDEAGKTAQANDGNPGLT